MLAQFRPALTFAVAIYHLSVTNISRGEGRGSLRSAAYLSGSRLIDTAGIGYDRTVIGGAAARQVPCPAEALEGDRPAGVVPQA